MVVLGIILAAAAVLLGIGVGISSSSSASIEGFGLEVDTTAALVYFAGAATVVALMLGLWMIKAGTARTYRRRREVKQLRRRVDSTPDDERRYDDRGHDDRGHDAREGDRSRDDAAYDDRATDNRATDNRATDDRATDGRAAEGRRDDVGVDQTRPVRGGSADGGRHTASR